MYRKPKEAAQEANARTAIPNLDSMTENVLEVFW